MTNMDFNGEPPAAGREDAGETTSPKDMAKAVVQTVKDEAASFADGAKEKAREHIDEGKQTATKTMGDFANAIRKAGDELAEHDQSMAGQMVRKAADGLESLSRSVSDKRPEEMLDAVRDFARNNPAAFIAGTVLVGLAIGRFAKSSERHGGDRGAAPGGMKTMRSEPASFEQERSFAPQTSAYPMPGNDGVDPGMDGAKSEYSASIADTRPGSGL